MFRMRQKIYLSCENFKIKQFSEKLNYQKIKTFKIKWQTKSVTFKLELLRHFKTYLIVHITLLKSASDNTKLAKIMNVKKYENQNYIIEKILARNQINKTNHYFVKWKKYDKNENIWKFIEHLEKIQQMLKNFLQCWNLLKNYWATQKK